MAGRVLQFWKAGRIAQGGCPSASLAMSRPGRSPHRGAVVLAAFFGERVNRLFERNIGVV